METQLIKSNRSPHPMVWIAGIAITVFAATGVAALMGWIPSSMGRAGEVGVPAPAPAAKSVTKSAQPASAAHAPASAPARVAAAPPANSAPAHPKCAECGVIESTREVDVRGEATGIGAVGGAVVGGILGNQVGAGHGREIATAAGAIGGVVAGNEIEKRIKTTKAYEVAVRLDDGSSRVVRETSAPAWRPGDHVKVVDGAIRSN